MWHVSSRSGVATLRTAIHLLLTYSSTESPVHVLMCVVFLACVHRSLFLALSLSPGNDATMSGYLSRVLLGACDARPAVTFPVAGRRRPSTGTLFILLGDGGTCVRTTCPGLLLLKSETAGTLTCDLSRLE